jgi:alkanesulfonate monooxygenase SsuD/methylene tetrahydromethanopterin reductase-like flavin-dependent oxidoreductase (luciferase family)
VNPWVLPLQKPHPPFWIPGLISPDTAEWCAKRRYPYVALATRLEPTIELFEIYGKAAASAGYQVGPENFGYLQPVMVADNQARAEELGKRLLFGGSFAHFARPEWMFPPGYNSKAATRRLATLDGPNTSGKPLFVGSGEETEAEIEAVKSKIYEGYPQVLRDLQMIAGTPDNVIPKLKKVIDVLRPGIFSFWLDGPVSAKDRRRCLELLNRDVIPALREFGRERGLTDPFECKPGSRPLASSGHYEAITNAAALAL